MTPHRPRPSMMVRLAALLMLVSVARAQPPETGSAPTTDTAATLPAPAAPSGVVLVVPVRGDVNAVLGLVINRALRRAARGNVDAILFEMDTFGGQLDAAIRIRDRLVTLDIPTITYVNNKAISAGSLIALSTDTIVMGEGSNIGAALPITLGAGGASAADQKFISVMASEMRKTAKFKNHPADIAEAFCNPDFELEGLKKKGDILTLDYDDAVARGLAAYVAGSLEDVLAREGLAGARIERFEETPTDRTARFLVNPVVMGLLMMLGVVGIFTELKAPGFGLPGAAGIGALALYFFGSYLAHLSGYMEIVAFVAGLALLGVEIFVLPGFGVAGVAGILLVFGSLFFALFNLAPEGFDFNFHRVEAPLWTMTISLIATAPVLWFMAWMLPKTPLYGHLTLAPPPRPGSAMAGAASPSAGEPGVAPAPASAVPPPLQPGRRGRALTLLRPSGKAMIDGRHIDVVSDGEFVGAGADIVVVAVEGARVVVRATE